MPTRHISPVAPVDPRRTIPTLGLGRGDPSITVDEDGAWIAIDTEDGSATLRFTLGDGLRAEAWGPGAECALELASGMVGAEDDPADFAPRHQVVARLWREHPTVRITRTRRVTAALLRAVFGQKVTGKEAKHSFRRMMLALGEPAPGPRTGLIAPARPSVIATLGYENFHSWGVERKRAETILEVARRSRRLEEAVAIPPNEARARITAIRGVGPWSAAVVEAQALGDADAVPVGDYNLPDLVAWMLAGEARADDARMLELLEPFRPHRGRVIRLLKAAGVTPPRYGPRAPLREIRGM